MKVVNTKLDEIASKLSAVYVSACPTASTRDKNKDNNLPVLPLDSEEDYQHFEHFVTDREENKLIMVSSAQSHWLT